MTTPTAEDRQRLAQSIQDLAANGADATLEDFRLRKILQSERTRTRVQCFIIVMSFSFIILALMTLLWVAPNRMLSAAIWALALGGLGAVSNVFINLLHLIPQQTLRTSDFFEVLGRTILGCIFGIIFATTIIAAEMTSFFGKIVGGDVPNSSPLLLLPFLAGFSTTLVLNIFEKMIRAIETTIGVEDQRRLSRSGQQSGVAPRANRRQGRV